MYGDNQPMSMDFSLIYLQLDVCCFVFTIKQMLSSTIYDFCIIIRNDPYKYGVSLIELHATINQDAATSKKGQPGNSPTRAGRAISIIIGSLYMCGWSTCAMHSPKCTPINILRTQESSV